MMWGVSTKFLGDKRRVAAAPAAGLAGRFPAGPAEFIVRTWIVPSPRGPTLSHGCCVWC